MNDPWIYRMIVGGLVAAILAVIIGSLILRASGVEAPADLAELAKMSLVFLGGLLAPSPLSKSA